MRALLCAAALCAAALPTRAADTAGNYAIWGVGGRSCHQFDVAAADPAEVAAFRDFLMGYLTAFNTLAPETYDALGGQPLENALEWLHDYCDQHQMDSFERALGQLLLARHDERSRVPPGSGRRGWIRPGAAASE
ncbi:MAG: hypothetical protein K2Y51_20930 [Gammaproteobacteria bacterium]|nr:hypothetical protein [Gammaproteobacteria bacterium]